MRRAIAIVLVVGIATCVVLVAGCSSTTSSSDPGLEADVTVAPTSGTVLTDFVFDAGGSSGKGRALEYRWDWENDGVWDTDWSTESTATRRFALGDTIEVALAVREGSEMDSTTVDITLDTRHGHVLHHAVLPDGFHTYGLTHDGSHLWFTGWLSNIYKADPGTGAIVDSIDGLTNWTGGITWDGTSLWVKDGGSMIERDPVTGATVSSWPVVYSGQHGGAAWDGTELYVGSDYTGSNGDGLIHKYTTDGTETGTIPSPRGSLRPRALSYDGEHLWVIINSSADTLYVVDPDDGEVQRTVGVSMSGQVVTIEDGYAWVVTTVGADIALTRIVP